MAQVNDSAIKRAVVTIKVFGVGGGGNSVLERIAESDFLDIELVAVNTDEKALAKVNLLGIKTLQIGQALTRGRGTGNKPELGELAAKNEEAQIKSIMHGADMIFITAGMGGGVGTGATPVIARIAKELGILTVGIMTIPFSFEGTRKKRIANEGIVKMQSYLDALIIVQNDSLMKLDKQLKLADAFHVADEALRQAIRCITELILTTGLVNVDFADVTTIFTQSKSADALLGIGESKRNAVEAVKQAAQSTLTEKSLKGARGIILNITGDESLSLYDVNDATDYIYSQTEDDVNIIFGLVIDNSMNGSVQAMIIATDFVDSLAIKTPTVQQSKSQETLNRGFNLDVPNFMGTSNSQTGLKMPSFSLLSNRDEKT